ncbi:MAG: DUF4404 family protein [Ignavibacteriaceae bacterium]
MENKLNQSLEQLHERLKKISSIDEESKNTLRKISNDINNLLEKPTEKAAEEKNEIIDSLKESATQFEADHPELAESIHIIIHTLSNMGM